MIDQLLISKKLYHEGCRQHELNDPISDGLATSLFQDAIEIYAWTLIKERGISVGKNSDFTTNLDAISKNGVRIPCQPKLHELNKARVNFKHYGNLPAHRDVGKFRETAQQFLVEACFEHFQISFSEISNLNLIHSVELKEYLLLAQEAAATERLLEAYENLAKAKYVLFAALYSRLPKFQTQDREADKNFKLLRELLLVAIYRIDLSEFQFMNSALPTVMRTVGNQFHINHFRSAYSLEESRRLYDFLLNVCLKEAL